MAYTMKANVTKRYAFVKQRISKARGKAKTIGLLYLLATIVLTALTCLSLVTLKVALEGGNFEVSLGVMGFLAEFDALKAGEKGVEWITLFAIYGALLLVLAINVIRSVVKLGWLLKSKASRLYGVNRNMYAMDDMGKIFSCSFACVIAFHFVYFLIPTVTVEIGTFAYVALAVGVLMHFVCGIPAGNVSLFSTQDGALVEEKRELGNFSPFVRNVFQIVGVAALMFLFVQSNILKNALDAFFAVGKTHIDSANGNMFYEVLVTAWAAIVPVLVGLIFLFTAIMLWYALGTVEFDMEGPEAAGRKTYLVCSVLTVLAVVALYLVASFVQPEAGLTQEFLTRLLIIGGVALVLVIVELCLRKCPKEEQENLDDVDTGTYITENYDLTSAYANTPLLNEFGEFEEEKGKKKYNEKRRK